jgi:3,4-dihydroxy 2-butanone 4-phosphate synthase/GTP cyclohydrolase II
MLLDTNDSPLPARLDTALRALREGRQIILVDDEDRENEGDLVLAAEFATPAAINFMAKEGRGLICLAMDAPMVDRLQLPMMTHSNEAPFGTAFTVSIEAREGVTTGISAADRAHTIQTAIRDGASRNDLVVPGHVFPLRARPGGVLVRAGQTEGSVDLARLAGLKAAAVICEILNDDGTMARRGDLDRFSAKHDIPQLSIAELIEYRLATDTSLIQEVAKSRLPTRFGAEFDLRVFESIVDGKDHVALTLGDLTSGSEAPLVRVHSECLTGDVFGSCRCDCGPQLDAALSAIAQEGRGVLLYLRQEGRGIGLRNKIRAYALQDQGMDTVDANRSLGFAADLRQYGIGAQILRQLGLRQMRLLSNNPKKIVGLQGFGLEVVDRVPLVTEPNVSNRFYLDTKKAKLGHLFP